MLSTNFYLLVCEFLAGVRLLWMIEPVDPDHHVAAPGLPHALDATDEGQVGAASGQEHCTVPDADHFSATHNGFVEELLSLPLHTASLEGPQRTRWSQSEKSDIYISLIFSLHDRKRFFSSPEWVSQTTSRAVVQEGKLKFWACSPHLEASDV